MSELLQRVSVTCFGLSYLLALVIEVARVRWPNRAVRVAGLVVGGAGLLAHSIYLVVHQPNPATAYGGLLAVAWVLAVFHLYGALHHGRRAWGLFVLPVVLVLVGLALFAVSPADPAPSVVPEWATGHRLWGAVHGLFVLLAAVGVCVGCVASVMYLIQSWRLRTKRNPLGPMTLLSLERLEAMNRRAVTVAFPLLTVGLLLGAVLLRQYHDFADNWASLKVLGTVGLWLVFLLLLYLRYAAHVPGRRLAWLTIAAFALMLAVLFATHPFASKEAEGKGGDEVTLLLPSPQVPRQRAPSEGEGPGVRAALGDPSRLASLATLPQGERVERHRGAVVIATLTPPLPLGEGVGGRGLHPNRPSARLAATRATAGGSA